MKKRLKRCAYCGELKADVRKRINPYEEEINNEKVWEFLCDDCESDLMEEI